MILLLDNYDSFSHNLAHLLHHVDDDIQVVRNDQCSVAECLAFRPRAVVISPGPGGPADTGIAADLVKALWHAVPVLGVCLGHQLLASLCGAEVVRDNQPTHGKASAISHDGRGLFQGLPQGLEVGRYHSLIVNENSCPADLEISARLKGRQHIMALRHKQSLFESVQFHPESILTEYGPDMLRNWMASSEALTS